MFRYGPHELSNTESYLEGMAGPYKGGSFRGIHCMFNVALTGTVGLKVEVRRKTDNFVFCTHTFTGFGGTVEFAEGVHPIVPGEIFYVFWSSTGGDFQPSDVTARVHVFVSQ